MKILNTLLLSLPTQGLLWLVFLFVFCFFGVHLFRLAIIGIQSFHNEEPEEEEIEEKKAPSEQPKEPIYYIVEKKTRRAKSSYSEPKEIRFK